MRGAIHAPLMRPILRVGDATRPTEVTSTTTDACFRAVVEGEGALRAWFEDETRTRRGEVTETGGPVPPRGPVCVRKGEKLRFIVETATSPSRTRAVVWQAP